METLALGAPAVADGYVYESQMFHIQGGAMNAFDAGGNTNCSGTPKVCTPLWGGVEGDGVAVANGLVYVRRVHRRGPNAHHGVRRHDGAACRERPGRSVIRAAHRCEREGLHRYAG